MPGLGCSSLLLIQRNFYNFLFVLPPLANTRARSTLHTNLKEVRFLLPPHCLRCEMLWCTHTQLQVTSSSSSSSLYRNLVELRTFGRSCQFPYKTAQSGGFRRFFNCFSLELSRYHGSTGLENNPNMDSSANQREITPGTSR